MGAVHAVILVAGSSSLVAVTVTVMMRMNQTQRRQMERRRRQWLAQGGRPEDEPKFDYLGGGGSSVGG